MQTSIAGCQVKETLGKGGMGTVFRAVHPIEGDVAIKILPKRAPYFFSRPNEPETIITKKKKPHEKLPQSREDYIKGMFPNEDPSVAYVGFKEAVDCVDVWTHHGQIDWSNIVVSFEGALAFFCSILHEIP